MINFKIYSYIEKFNLSQENFLEFVTKLSDYFSKKFGVRKCLVEIRQLEARDSSFGKIPPAEYSGVTISRKDVKTGKNIYERIEESIKFSFECSQETNKARIVKLIAHEWMHFYNSLFRWRELDRDLADEEYKELIIKSIHYDRDLKKMLKEKYDKSIYACLNKLAAVEAVADKHAQSFLKDLYQNITDEKLKEQIQFEIQKHDKLIMEFKKYLEKNNINEECVVSLK